MSTPQAPTRRCPHCASRPFETVYRQAPKGPEHRYRTHAPTLAHARIRAASASAHTLRYDFGVRDWPFGAWAEVMASTPSKRRRPK